MSVNRSTDLTATARSKAVPVLLDFVCRVSGAGMVAVSRISEARWQAVAVRDEAGCGLRAGDELALEGTLCETVRRTGQRVVMDAPGPETAPYFRAGAARPDFQSYISVPISRADGSFFGTLCAAARETGAFGCSDTIAMFEAFAELIGFQLSALERERVAEANLAEARETAILRERFIAVLGHDLRNPLTAILGGMEMLRRTPMSERAAQWAEIVAASAQRMAELIDVVEDFSRSQLGGTFAIECSLTNGVRDGLRRVVEGLESRGKPGRPIETELKITEAVFCDLRRIEQLALNLLKNALEYGDPLKPVRLCAATTDGSFSLEVTNGGEPISPQLMPRIFEPFTRGAAEPAREGLGLGLYLARQIALAHGGTLECFSTSKETRFSLRMPLRRD